jgi:hypothetical protein
MEAPGGSAQYPSATIPIDLARGVFLSMDGAKAYGAALADAYSSALPYPHIVIDDFLPEPMADEILRHFPTAPLAHDMNYEGRTFEHKKRGINPHDCDEVARGFFLFFNSAPFIQFLESLTGIDGLLPDPHFEGGGFHEISKGGKLGIHADFRIQRRLHVNRRINVLIYLNKAWNATYGGELEIWNTALTEKMSSIQPLFNRCVIFNTNADSYHGHPEPLNTPNNVTRKSLALYYYTASKAVYGETANLGTMFKARPNDDPSIKLAAEKQNKAEYFAFHQWLPPIVYQKLRDLKRKYIKVAQPLP